jgi:hypothetical protein
LIGSYPTRLIHLWSSSSSSSASSLLGNKGQRERERKIPRLRG